jgi:hypothetical protein
MHDMTGGDREEEDRGEMEKAMIEAYEKKELKRNKTALLVEKNLGTYYEGANQIYIDVMNKLSTASSSNSQIPPIEETKTDIEMTKSDVDKLKKPTFESKGEARPRS